MKKAYTRPSSSSALNISLPSLIHNIHMYVFIGCMEKKSLEQKNFHFLVCFENLLYNGWLGGPLDRITWVVIWMRGKNVVQFENGHGSGA
jgi:hypothetical protein